MVHFVLWTIKLFLGIPCNKCFICVFGVVGHLRFRPAPTPSRTLVNTGALPRASHPPRPVREPGETSVQGWDTFQVLPFSLLSPFVSFCFSILQSCFQNTIWLRNSNGAGKYMTIDGPVFERSVFHFCCSCVRVTCYLFLYIYIYIYKLTCSLLSIEC